MMTASPLRRLILARSRCDVISFVLIIVTVTVLQTFLMAFLIGESRGVFTDTLTSLATAVQHSTTQYGLLLLLSIPLYLLAFHTILRRLRTLGRPDAFAWLTVFPLINVALCVYLVVAKPVDDEPQQEASALEDGADDPTQSTIWGLMMSDEVMRTYLMASIGAIIIGLTCLVSIEYFAVIVLLIYFLFGVAGDALAGRYGDGRFMQGYTTACVAVAVMCFMILQSVTSGYPVFVPMFGAGVLITLIGTAFCTGARAVLYGYSRSIE